MNPTASDPPSATERNLFDQLWEQELQHLRRQGETRSFRPTELALDEVFRRYRIYTRQKAAPLRNRQLRGEAKLLAVHAST